MKRLLAFTLCLAVMALQAAVAQEFNFSSEMKTGVYWESRQKGDEEAKQTMQLGNSDGDSGGFNPATNFFNIPGRFRLNLEFKPISSIGFRVRFEDSTFTGRNVAWTYSYAYGDFLDEQLKISAGKLGDSPWKTGGPELNTAIGDESYGNSFAGVRTEYKPSYLPGLNIGFVLNPPNHMTSANASTFAIFMRETVLGVAYTHDLFHVRFAWRLDGEDMDNLQDEDGHSMVYRVEEKALARLVPGLEVSANGIWEALVNGMDKKKNFQNWLYITFKEYNFDAQLRVGYQVGNKQGDEFFRKLFTIKPIVLYSITPIISAGATFVYAKDFGELSKVDYDNFTVEPQVKVTFNPFAYVAMVYGYQQLPREGLMEKAHYLNLRLVFSF